MHLRCLGRPDTHLLFDLTGGYTFPIAFYNESSDTVLRSLGNICHRKNKINLCNTAVGYKLLLSIEKPVVPFIDSSCCLSG